jgi:hypothetical protein
VDLRSRIDATIPKSEEKLNSKSDFVDPNAKKKAKRTDELWGGYNWVKERLGVKDYENFSEKVVKTKCKKDKTLIEQCLTKIKDARLINNSEKMRCMVLWLQRALNINTAKLPGMIMRVPHSCEVCKKEFISGSTLKEFNEHRLGCFAEFKNNKRMHDEQWDCKTCKKQFIWKKEDDFETTRRLTNELQAHIQTCHPINETTWSCQLCGCCIEANGDNESAAFRLTQQVRIHQEQCNIATPTPTINPVNMKEIWVTFDDNVSLPASAKENAILIKLVKGRPKPKKKGILHVIYL